MKSIMSVAFAIGIFTAVIAAPGAMAQGFPDRSVVLVVPYPPGGGTDILGRIIAQKFSTLWGVNMIVDNRGGASGLIGGAYVAKAAPDGYTILMAPNSYTISANVQKNMPFDLVAAFAPLGMIATSPLTLAVNAALPAKNVAELVAYAKANPGKLNHGSAGSATAPHLAGELFNIMAGIKIAHVPYRGTGPATAALLSNEVQLSFNPFNSIEGFVRDGRIRVLAVLGSSRHPGLPDVPTVAESGLRGYEVDLWYSLLAPAGTPKDVIAKLNTDLRRTLDAADIKQSLTQKGFTPAHSTPQGLAHVIRNDLARWKGVTDRVRITID